MLTASVRIRVQEIICRLKDHKSVTLQERIYLSNLSMISSVVSDWLYSALADQAHAIDQEI